MSLEALYFLPFLLLSALLVFANQDHSHLFSFVSNNQLSGPIPTELQRLPLLGSLFLLPNPLCPLLDYSAWAKSNDSPGSTECECAAGLTGDNCTVPCGCSSPGSLGSCSRKGHCHCLSGYTGTKCTMSVAAIVVPIVLVVVFALGAVFFVLRRRRKIGYTALN